MSDSTQRGDDAIPTLPTWVRGEPRPCVPERVGQYRVQEKLGAGGAGEVWAAHDETLDRRVALKLVPRGRVGNEQETRLLREAHALAKLSHPNVVTVHDADRIKGFVYIAMELVEGGTLKEAFSDSARTTRDRLALLCQAARGLQAAHAHGLIHRDFKPANALLGKDGRVRVADFGLARLAEESGAEPLPAAAAPIAPTFSELTVTGAVLGTPAYMSPEQRLGRTLTPAADQFSFCVVAWQALYGVNPLAELNLAAWVAGDASIPAPPGTTTVPAVVHEALVRGLEAEPDARHESMAPLLHALESVLAPPRFRRARWVLAGAGALAVSATAALLFTAPDDPCTGLSLDWSAIERPMLAARLADGTDEGVAAGRAASQGLDAFARRWARDAEAACRANAPQPECQQERRAAFSTAKAMLGTDGGRASVPDVLASMAEHCGEDVTPTTVELARLKPRLAAGDATAVVAESIALEQFDQDTPQIRAEILKLRGAALRQQGDAVAALEAIRVAYNNAERAGAHALAAELAAELAALTAVELGQPERSPVWLDIAEALTDPPPAVEVSISMARGRVFEASGSWSDAADAYLRAAALQRDAAPYLDGPAEAQVRAASALIDAGRPEDATPLVDAALARRRALYGPTHPKTRSAQRVRARL